MAALVPDILGADAMAAALLIECRGRDAGALQASIDEVSRALLRHGLPFGAKAAEPKALETYPFSHDAKVRFWGLSLSAESMELDALRNATKHTTLQTTKQHNHKHPSNNHTPFKQSKNQTKPNQTKPNQTKPKQTCKTFWDVRKGLIPIVGAAREAGTSMLIEDVACPVDKLADMMIDLIDMFQVAKGWIRDDLGRSLVIRRRDAGGGIWCLIMLCPGSAHETLSLLNTHQARAKQQHTNTPTHNPNKQQQRPPTTTQRYGYNDASCFGHALEGNLHLVFSQGFRTKEEVQRFSNLMEEMCHIVANKHSGSLKGEHGTGRNVAAFVEMEWGSKAYELMWELKQLFDPEFVLNPGALFL